MPLFLIGYALAMALAFGSVGVWRWTNAERLPTPRLGDAAAIVLAVGIAWVVAEIVARWRSPRIFHPRVHAGGAALARGIGAGVLTLLLSAAAFVLLPRTIPDGVVTGVSSLVGCSVLLLTAARVRSGLCVVCGYPGEAGRVICCECGRARTA